MKYKILVSSTEETVNIGDFIQGVAASQFLPSMDGYIQREKLKDYDGEECAVIMNGWYMWHPEQWPPSENIHPLFVSFHINKLNKDRIFIPESVQYLKKHEPIGCRDYFTCTILESVGIRNYFTGCLTLTLGRNFYTVEKDNGYIFTDPICSVNWTIGNIMKYFLFYFFHLNEVEHIVRKHPLCTTFLKKRLHVSAFYKEYSSIFDKSILLDADYITHLMPFFKNMEQDESEKLYHQLAIQLIQKYAKAKLVVTSRIHCALPCLGLGTSVLYINDLQSNKEDNCRMKGLFNLFDVINWSDGHLIKPEFIEGKIQKSTIIKNSKSSKSITEKLTEICRKWAENFKDEN